MAEYPQTLPPLYEVHQESDGMVEDFVPITDARIMELELELSGTNNLDDDFIFKVATRDAPALLAEIHRLKPFEEIVRELAARDAPMDSDLDVCLNCIPGDSPLLHMSDNPANHEPSCLWRRARELYPQPVVPAAEFVITNPAPRYTGEMGKPPGR